MYQQLGNKSVSKIPAFRGLRVFLEDDLRISYIFHRLILSTLNFKKWTLRKIRPSIDMTMDQQKSLHHHRLSDGSLHKILVTKQAVQELASYMQILKKAN